MGSKSNYSIQVSLLFLFSFSFHESMVHRNKPGRKLEASRDHKLIEKLRESRYGQLSDRREWITNGKNTSNCGMTATFTIIKVLKMDFS